MDNELESLLIDICQLIDSHGTVPHELTDWDKQVRQRISDYRASSCQPHIMRSDLLKQYDAMIELTARMLWYEFPDDEFRHSEAVANWVYRIRQIANEIKGRCA